jgi:O-antigen/teichoic acid export membrane protein
LDGKESELNRSAPVLIARNSGPSEQPAPKRDSFLTNYASVVSAQGVSTIANFLLVVIVSRHYGVEQFGLFTYVFALSELMYFVAEFGFPSVIVSEAPHFQYSRDFYAGVFRLQIAFVAVALACVLVVQQFALHDTTQRIMGAAVAFYLLSQAPSRTLRSVFRSFERTKYEAVTTLAEKTAALIVAAIAAVLNWPLVVFAIGLALVGFVNVVMLLVVCYARFVDVIRIKNMRQIARIVLTAATPLGMSAMFCIVNLRIGTVILEHYRNSVEVGLFGAAQRLITPLVYIVTTLQAAVLPILARRVTDESEGVRSSLGWLLRWILAASFLLVICLEAFGSQVIRLVFGSAYLPAGPLLHMLTVSVPLTFLLNMASLALFLERRYRLFMIGWGLSSVVAVLVNLVLVPYYGAVGVAYGIILSEAILLISTLWFARGFIGSKSTVLLATVTLLFISTAVFIPTYWRIVALSLLTLGIIPRKNRRHYHWLQMRTPKTQLRELRSIEVGSVAG